MSRATAWAAAKRGASIAMEVFRYLWSTALLLFSLGAVLYAQIEYDIVFYPGVPNWVAVILLFVFLAILGIMEGTMIALTQLRKVDPETYRTTHKHAYRTALYSYRGSRIERFLNGRQVFVVICGFQLARLTTPAALPEVGFFFEALLTSGLLGSFIVCILGQLTPQIFAAKFPYTFLNIPFLGFVVRLCLAVEFTGITYSCWAISRAIVKISGQPWSSDVAEPKDDQQAAAERVRDHAYHFRTLRTWLEELAAAITADQDDNAPAPTFSATDELADAHDARAAAKTGHVTAAAAAVPATVQEHLRDDSLPVEYGGRLYSSPASLRTDLDAKGLWRLSFLRSPDDPLYVPPHIVATALYAETARLRAQSSRQH